MNKLLPALGILALGIAAYSLRPQAPLPVALHPVDKGDVEQLASNSRAGTIKACQRSELSLQRGGRVASLQVDEGQRVKAGALLMELENAEETVRVELSSAELKVAQLEEQRACDLASLAQREADRAASLSKRNLVSGERLDQLNTEALNQTLQCSQSRALTERAEAALKLAQVSLEQTRLYAPFSGVVASVNAEIGEYATPSTPGIQLPPAIDLIDDACLYVEAPIDEVEASRVMLGQPARITLDAYRGAIFNGIVGRIDATISAAEKQARTLSIDVHFTPPPDDLQLLVGYSADTEVITGLHQDVIRIPTQALINGTTVYRYQPDTQTLQAVEVQTGLGNWTWTEISSGLEVGDRILTRIENLSQLLEGKVAPTEP